MRINAYPAVQTMTAQNVLVLDGPDGTKTINGKDAGIALNGLISPEQHRMIFRGKNLGSAPTPQQLAAIRDGSFTDLYLGDYWVNGGITYRIADFNYWSNSGDTAFTKPHLVIVPDQAMGNAQMEATNITTNGYFGSAMRQTTIPGVVTTLQGIFGSALQTHREYLTNASASGRPSAGSWYDSIADIMQETQVYGGTIFAVHSDGTTIPNLYTINKQQFALFAMVPKFVNPGRYSYWLRDVISAANFAFVNNDGPAHSYGASGSLGVRPCFAIG